MESQCDPLLGCCETRSRCTGLCMQNAIVCLCISGRMAKRVAVMCQAAGVYTSVLSSGFT